MPELSLIQGVLSEVLGGVPLRDPLRDPLIRDPKTSQNLSCYSSCPLRGRTPSTAGTFRKKFRKDPRNALTLRVRLGSPKPYNSRHLRLSRAFPEFSPPHLTAGDASFFRNGSGEGLSELLSWNSQQQGISDLGQHDSPQLVVLWRSLIFCSFSGLNLLMHHVKQTAKLVF